MQIKMKIFVAFFILALIALFVDSRLYNYLLTVRKSINKTFFNFSYDMPVVLAQKEKTTSAGLESSEILISNARIDIKNLKQSTNTENRLPKIEIKEIKKEWTQLQKSFSYRKVSNKRKSLPHTQIHKIIYLTIKGTRVKNARIYTNVPGNWNKSIANYYLNKGPVHLETSALPGKPGLSVIYGHSAIEAILRRRYIPNIYIFTALKDAKVGQYIDIKTDNETVHYQIKKKFLINPSQLQSLKRYHDPQKFRLLLITCWPPGLNSKRLVILAEK